MFVEHHELIKSRFILTKVHFYGFHSLMRYPEVFQSPFEESTSKISTFEIYLSCSFVRSSFPHKPLVQLSPICWLVDSYVFIRERVGYVCDKSRRTHRRRLIRVVGEPNHAKAVILHTRSLSEHTITGAFLRFFYGSIKDHEYINTCIDGLRFCGHSGFFHESVGRE